MFKKPILGINRQSIDRINDGRRYIFVGVRRNYTVTGITNFLIPSKLLFVSSEFFADIGGGIFGGRSLSGDDSSSESFWFSTGRFPDALGESVESQVMGGGAN